MKAVFKLVGGLVASAAMLAAVAFVSMGQVPSSNPPYNTDTGALITLAPVIGGNGTQTSASQTNLDKNAVVCTYVQTASSGAASTTFEVDAFDNASQQWNQLVTSSAISGPVSGATYTVWVQPGLIAADVPSNGAGKSTHLPRVWRVKSVTAGVNSATATIGCNLLK